MPIDIVEMLWECTHCKTTNPGRRKECTNCGKAKTLNCKEWLPDDVSHESVSVVTEKELLHKFVAGPDWKCKYCDSLEWKVDGSCAQCGSSQDEKKEFEEIAKAAPQPVKPHATVMSSLQKGAEGALKKPARKIETIDLPQVDHDPFVGIGDQEEIPIHRFPAWAAIALLGSCFAIILIMYLIFHTVTHHATVSTVSWTETAHIERNQVVHSEGWNAPNDAFDVHNLGRRINHYDHVVDHYDTVSYTYQEQCGQTCTSIPRSCYTTSRSCTSNKNGSATCSGGDRVCSGGGQSCIPKYCTKTGTRKEASYRDDPVYQEYYEWNAWEWVFNRNVIEQGTDTSPHPPSQERLALNDNERATIVTVLTVSFTDDDDHEVHNYEPKTLEEFKSFTVGTKKTIQIGSMGGVTIKDDSQ